jgi:mRNA interferase RelE/StbE
VRAPLEGQREAVRGSYRVTYRIVEQQVLVEVVRVAHRSDVYRP